MATLALPTLAAAPGQPAGWLLIAQSDRKQPTCELDGRQVPLGMTYCRDGNVVKCNRNGSWERTDKRC